MVASGENPGTDGMKNPGTDGMKNPGTDGTFTILLHPKWEHKFEFPDGERCP
jgi:hypothetical protein